MQSNSSLELYYKPSCPYCQRVLNYLEEAGRDVPLKNIETDSQAAKTLVEVGGKRQVPCLFIEGKPLYESSDIVEWLKDNG